MYTRFLSSTRTLTGRLGLFFTAVSCVIGIVTSFIFSLALQWSEDRVGERRILIDRDSAVERFIAGESGKIQLDALTAAYNDMALVPEPYAEYLSDKANFIGELEGIFAPTAHMAYKGYYTVHGDVKTIVLLTLIDKVEFEADEMVYSGIIVVSFVSLLMFAFGTLLYRLSKRLIEPLNEIASQLEQQSGNSSIEFSISPESAVEFKTLAASLNMYRSELNSALKREQAFARYASHELRTPLTVVKGANKLLLRTDHTEFQSRQINRIDTATNEMITMVDALLSIVRYERSIDDAPFRDVNQLEFEAIVTSNAIQASEKGISVNLNYQSPPSVRATPAVMNMVLGNLIRNAIAASERGNIDIRVDSDELIITDDGPGLSNSSNKDGHGLGLLIVDDLCRRYQWKFKLENHPNRGCIARINF